MKALTPQCDDIGRWGPLGDNENLIKRKDSNQEPYQPEPQSWFSHPSELREINCFCCLSHSVGGTLLWKPELTNTEIKNWQNIRRDKIYD